MCCFRRVGRYRFSQPRIVSSAHGSFEARPRVSPFTHTTLSTTVPILVSSALSGTFTCRLHLHNTRKVLDSKKPIPLTWGQQNVHNRIPPCLAVVLACPTARSLVATNTIRHHRAWHRARLVPPAPCGSSPCAAAWERTVKNFESDEEEGRQFDEWSFKKNTLLHFQAGQKVKEMHQ